MSASGRAKGRATWRRVCPVPPCTDRPLLVRTWNGVPRLSYEEFIATSKELSFVMYETRPKSDSAARWHSVPRSVPSCFGGDVDENGARGGRDDRDDGVGRMQRQQQRSQTHDDHAANEYDDNIVRSSVV